MLKINFKTHYVPVNLFCELSLREIHLDYVVYFYKIINKCEIIIYYVYDPSLVLEIYDDINIFPSNFINKLFIDNYLTTNLSSFILKKNKYLESNISNIDLDDIRCKNFLASWMSLNKSITVLLLKFDDLISQIVSITDIFRFYRIIDYYSTILDMGLAKKKIDDFSFLYIEQNFYNIIFDPNFIFTINNSYITPDINIIFSKICLMCISNIPNEIRFKENTDMSMYNYSSSITNLLIVLTTATKDENVINLIKYYCLEYVKYLSKKNKNQELYSIFTSLKYFNNPVSLFIQKIVSNCDPNNLLNTKILKSDFHKILENIF